MNLTTCPIHNELLKDSVLITGSPRSGTTLLGKIVGSLDHLEYHFEPPTFYMLTAAYAAGKLDSSIAKELLQLYMCEDLLLESIHGRGVNLRPNDDSQILNRLSWKELNNRWLNIRNRADAIEFCQEQDLKLAIKAPNVFDSLDLLQETLPGVKILVSVRNGGDVIRSILAKGWVEDKNLDNDLWPYKQKDVPYWVPESYQDKWSTMIPINRATLMWCTHAKMGIACRNQKNVYEVRYEDLVSQPWHMIELISKWLGHRTTPNTRRWVDSIHPARSNESNAKLKKIIEPELASMFTEINVALGY